MDLLPPHVGGVSAGFLNTAGQLAGLAAPVVIGALIQWTGRYEAGFLSMAFAASVSAALVMTLKERKPVLAEVPL